MGIRRNKREEFLKKFFLGKIGIREIQMRSNWESISRNKKNYGYE